MIKKLSGGSKSLCFRLRVLISTVVAICLLASNLLIVNAQTQSLKGQSNTVILVPNTTVNASEIRFKSDRDHDGMSDEAEPQTAPTQTILRMPIPMRMVMDCRTATKWRSDPV